jgi:hypothetical protein
MTVSWSPGASLPQVPCGSILVIPCGVRMRASCWWKGSVLCSSRYADVRRAASLGRSPLSSCSAISASVIPGFSARCFAENSSHSSLSSSSVENSGVGTGGELRDEANRPPPAGTGLNAIVARQYSQFPLGTPSRHHTRRLSACRDPRASGGQQCSGYSQATGGRTGRQPRAVSKEAWNTSAPRSRVASVQYVGGAHAYSPAHPAPRGRAPRGARASARERARWRQPSAWRIEYRRAVDCRRSVTD